MTGPEPLPAFPSLEFEEQLWKTGLERIGGVDEAGRGALAGPVAAAVVILPRAADLPALLAGVRDSKLMTARQRTIWAERIKQAAVAWGVGFASPAEIDRLGILPCTRLAVLRALDQLAVAPQHLLLDYLHLPQSDLPQTALVKGDRRCLSIAAASVLAKTARDALMAALDDRFPGYGLARHKGYGTRAHQEALRRLGASRIHRRSFVTKFIRETPA